VKRVVRHTHITVPARISERKSLIDTVDELRLEAVQWLNSHLLPFLLRQRTCRL